MEIKFNKIIQAVVLFSLLLNSAFSVAEPSIVSGQTAEANAGAYSGPSTKFAIMTSNKMQFGAAVNAAKQMQVDKNNYTFEIVVVGELPKVLANDSSLIKEIDTAEKLGVNIVLCEVAVSYFKVPKEKLDKRLKFTTNGWAHMFQLKDDGFNTLSAN